MKKLREGRFVRKKHPKKQIRNLGGLKLGDSEKTMQWYPSANSYET